MAELPAHNTPLVGGGGHIVANAFLPAHRFDFLTFDHADTLPTRGAVDELGRPVTLDNVADSRATVGMFGAGYIEMLARQMTQALQAQRNALQPGQSVALTAKGVSFGTLARNANGSWNVSGVEGLPAASIAKAAEKTKVRLPIMVDSCCYRRKVSFRLQRQLLYCIHR